MSKTFDFRKLPNDKLLQSCPIKSTGRQKEGFCLVGKHEEKSTMNYPQIENILGGGCSHIRNVIFLGIEEDFTENQNNSECSQASKVDDYERGCAWFAADVGHVSLASKKFLEFCPGTEYLSARPGFLQVHVEDATILAQARPILEWHQFNKFCPRCGSAVTMDDGGYKQTCTNGECSSNKGISTILYRLFSSDLFLFSLATIHELPTLQFPFRLHFCPG